MLCWPSLIARGAGEVSVEGGARGTENFWYQEFYRLYVLLVYVYQYLDQEFLSLELEG